MQNPSFVASLRLPTYSSTNYKYTHLWKTRNGHYYSQETRLLIWLGVYRSVVVLPKCCCTYSSSLRPSLVTSSSDRCWSVSAHFGVNSPFPELPPLSYFLYSPNNILLLTRLSSSSDVGVDGVVVCKMISFAETAGYRRVEGDIRNKDRCNSIGTPSRTTTLLCVRSSRVAAAATATAETFIIPPRRRMCRAHMAN